MKFLILILILLCFGFYSRAQSITWEKQFHFDEHSDANQPLETSDGGFLIPCNTSDSTGSFALWIVKLDKNGDFQWRKIIDTMDGMVFCFVKKSPSVYSLVDFGGYYNDWDIVDFDENGNVLWTKKQSQDSNTFIISGILSLGNGNYITQGFLSNSLNNPTMSYMIVQKYNRRHQMVWSDTFNLAQFANYGPLLKTHDNKLLIGGDAGSAIYDKFSFLLLLDTNGKKINYVQYPYIKDSSEQMDYMAQFSNGNIITETSGNDFSEIYFTLADSAGNTKKRWEFDGMFINGIGGMVTDGDSVYVVTSFGIDAGPLTLIKYGTDFNQIWSKDFDDASGYYNDAGSIIRTSDNGLLLTATRSRVFDTGEPSDMVAIKLDGKGNLDKADYNGIKNSIPNNIISVYPNPASDHLYINSTQNTNKYHNLDIFDGRGDRVVIMSIKSGAQKIDISGLSRGLYMYRLYNESGMYCEGKFVKE